MTMRFGLALATVGVPLPAIVEMAQVADDLPFEGIWIGDHLLFDARRDDRGTFEAMTTLAVLSSVTEHVRLGVLVADARRRHPALLAAQAMTVDHASGGRLDLGLGLGHSRERSGPQVGAARGDERSRALERSLSDVASLLAGEALDPDDSGYPLLGDRLIPLPLQRPHPPLWVGGRSPEVQRLAASYADAWHAWGGPDELWGPSQRVTRMAEEAGRDPAKILRAASVSVENPDAAVASVARWEEAGFGYLVCRWPDGGHRTLQRFLDTVDTSAR